MGGGSYSSLLDDVKRGTRTLQRKDSRQYTWKEDFLYHLCRGDVHGQGTQRVLRRALRTKH